MTLDVRLTIEVAVAMSVGIAIEIITQRIAGEVAWRVWLLRILAAAGVVLSLAVVFSMISSFSEARETKPLEGWWRERLAKHPLRKVSFFLVDRREGELALHGFAYNPDSTLGATYESTVGTVRYSAKTNVLTYFYNGHVLTQGGSRGNSAARRGDCTIEFPSGSRLGSGSGSYTEEGDTASTDFTVYRVPDRVFPHQVDADSLMFFWDRYLKSAKLGATASQVWPRIQPRPLARW